MKILHFLKKIELFLGNVRFAVLILVAFAIYLGYGTVQESYYGAEYANIVVYKSIPFMILQLLMFLSIFFATAQRFPYKPKMLGFYTLHLGLMLIFAGSVVTYIAGIDGSLTLPPNTPNNQIALGQHQVRINWAGKEAIFKLPQVSSPVLIDQYYKGIHLKNYLPYATQVLVWKDVETPAPSSQYLLSNPMLAQEITLSRHPDSDFKSTLSLGPLNVHYLYPNLLNCFKMNNKSKLIFWDTLNQTCYDVDQLSPVFKTVEDKLTLKLQFQGREYRFFPQIAPIPFDEQGSLLTESSFRLFNQEIFEKQPHLFVFGPGFAYFDKDQEKWVAGELGINNTIELPWMGFKLKLLQHETHKAPIHEPKYTKPLQKGGDRPPEYFKAIEVQFIDESFWLSSETPQQINYKGESIQFFLEAQSVKLPYELTLSRFKMDTDPGTSSPASYESFVDIFDGEQTTKAHIFMNHPFKKDPYTFYQASYFESQAGGYGSVLSVNFDPGRFWKYLGSLLLVLGSFWHFYVRRRKTTKAAQ